MTFTLALTITTVVGVVLFAALVAEISRSAGSVAEAFFVAIALVVITGLVVAGSIAMGMMWESVER